jgi:hypothetical protein
MATFTKLPLSGSTNGKAVLVAAIATAGTLIHTAVSGTTNLDEVWLYAQNTSTSSVMLDIEWGGTTAPNDLIELTVLPEAGLVTVIPGFLLQNGLVIRAFAGTANVITIHGFVNRITA